MPFTTATGRKVAVASAAEFLARILEDAPQPLWVVDAQGFILFINPAAVATLGYDDVAELRGRQSHEAVHYKWPDGSPCPRAECPMRPPVDDGRPAKGEDEWFVRRDGSMFPIAWWYAPIALAEGHGSVLMFTDITERRADEQALRERDAAEIRATESRAAERRIVESAAAVRRQIAQDLHDGAQQRLTTVLLELQRAGEETMGDPGRMLRLLDTGITQTQRAIDELRELTARVYPAILAHRGLVAAVEDLAAHLTLPVAVTGSLPHRLPEAVETHAYFFVSEALTTVATYSRATQAAVVIGVEDAVLSVEVRADGVGGATANDAGGGLAGMTDRVEALGGRMVLRSPRGQGTTMHATIPVGLPAG